MTKKDSKLVPFRLAWVQTYLAVLNEGSFSAAAIAIGCNQSTVSRSIEQLGGFLGGKLFDGSTPSKPTALGEAFYPQAEKLMAWARDCRKLKDHVAASNAALPSTRRRRRFGFGLF